MAARTFTSFSNLFFGGFLRHTGFGRVVLTKDAVLHVHAPVVGAERTASFTTEIHAFAPLPAFDSRKEQTSFDKYNAPFPVNWRMLEHDSVEHWYVEDGKDGDEAEDDSVE